MTRKKYRKIYFLQRGKFGVESIWIFKIVSKVVYIFLSLWHYISTFCIFADSFNMLCCLIFAFFDAVSKFRPWNSHPEDRAYMILKTLSEKFLCQQSYVNMLADFFTSNERWTLEKLTSPRKVVILWRVKILTISRQFHLKVPSGQIGSAWEWYNWKAL